MASESRPAAGLAQRVRNWVPRLKSRGSDTGSASGSSDHGGDGDGGGGGEDDKSPGGSLGDVFNPIAWDSLTPPPTQTRIQAPTHNAVEENDKMSRSEKRRSRVISQPKGTISYNVEGSDTLASIAAQFDTTTSDLKRLNKLMSTMIFPGQALYVPDKDYIPSSGSSPAVSPTDNKDFPPLSPAKNVNKQKPPDIPIVGTRSRPKLTSPKPAPGHAERQEVEPTELPKEKGAPRAISGNRAKQLDQECFERFLKINVKHITDGQGVVGGVLLVTPNAVMFDPNVSDPLVLEQGPDMYGMIAPMETIISAAMYHDIAAMKVKSAPQDGNRPKPKVYHAESCPKYSHTAPVVEEEAEENMQEQDQIEEPKQGLRHRTQSSCSCGADLFLAATEKNEINLGPNEVKDTLDQSEKKDRSHTYSQPIREEKQSPQEAAAATSPEEYKLDSSTDPEEGGAASDARLIDLNGNNKSNGAVSSSTAADQSGSTDDNSASTHDSNQNHQPASAAPSCAADDNIFQFDDSVVSRQDSVEQLDPPSPMTLTRTTGEEPGNSVPSHDATSPVAMPESSEKGIFRRTLGSVGNLASSLGSSLPTTPNMSSIVNFSSGLFARSSDDGKDRMKDASEVDMMSLPQSRSISPPRTSWYIADASPSKESGVSPGGGEARKRVGGDITQERADDKKVAVENIIRLSDRPELFRSLDELIPRPATLYEDPPLYLCLRIGIPRKQLTNTCPIESYIKKRKKPEYWFSIPKDRVDQLYAFFIQWSPNIYGSEEDIDPAEQGFIVVEEEEVEEELEDMAFIDDHYKGSVPNKKLTRTMSKNWEIVNKEEARRRISEADEENLPPPELLDTSTILQEQHVRRLSKNLLPRAEGYPWTLVYSSDKHGFSLKTLYRAMRRIDCPVLLCVKDTRNQLFGAMLSYPLKMSDHFYGTGESFLWTFYKEFKKFVWTGSNNFFTKGNTESLGIGAGEGSFGLWLDGDLYHGRTQMCQTYDNDILTESEDFVIKCVEAWGFI